MCSRCATLDGRCAELEPVLEQPFQAVDGGAAVEPNDVDVDSDRALELGRRKQMVHQRVEVDFRLPDQHETRRVLVVGLVAQILHHRQLLGCHLRHDLLEDLGAGRLERQLFNHDLAVLYTVARTQAQRAAAGLVDLHDVRAARDELAARREIGPLDVLHQVAERGVRIVEQLDQSRGDFFQIVRRHVRRHADGNAARAVQQEVR